MKNQSMPIGYYMKTWVFPMIGAIIILGLAFGGCDKRNDVRRSNLSFDGMNQAALF